jgi:uncharacterized protein YqgV (UPF0045/DUF77 family)
MTLINDYLEISAQNEKAKSEQDRAEGALETVMSNLKKVHGLTSMKAVVKKRTELEAEEKALEKKLAKKIKAYKEKWPDESD